jgi:hypothetical protein
LRPRALITAVVLVSLLIPGRAAGQDQMIVTVAGWSPPIDAYHGRVLWSEPSPGGYRLVVYHDGVVRPLPVAPSTVPFEIDLGPDRHGRVVAVYPRCAQVPAYYGPVYDGPPIGCDLYLYDFRRVRETPIRRANSTRADERYPAIWKSRLVFARSSGFYWRSLKGRGPSRLLRQADVGYFPSGADLRGKLAALAFNDRIDSGALDLVQIRGRTRKMHSNPFGRPSIGPRYVYWRAAGGDRYYGFYSVLTRYDRARESDERAFDVAKRWLSFAQDGSTSYYMARLPGTCGNCEGPVGLYRATGIRF